MHSDTSCMQRSRIRAACSALGHVSELGTQRTRTVSVLLNRTRVFRKLLLNGAALAMAVRLAASNFLEGGGHIISIFIFLCSVPFKLL